MSLPPELQDLVDKQALCELVTRACRGVDRADGDLLLSCYWPDAHDDHGAYKGDPAGLLAHLRRKTMAPGASPVQHAVSNSLFEVRGDDAWGETYVESRAVGDDGSVVRGVARYVDRYERRSAEWRIIRRRVVLESARPGFNTSDFVAGHRTTDDPSYEREGSGHDTAC